MKTRSAERVSGFRRGRQITVIGKNVPNPIETFEETQFPKYIMDPLRASGFTSPTSIQCQGKDIYLLIIVWPAALSGRDLVGVAETGSGKTLAYALPAIVHINGQRLLEPGEGPVVLVMVPTRELATQIHKECEKFSATCQISTAAIYGGAERATQQRLLQRG